MEMHFFNRFLSWFLYHRYLSNSPLASNQSPLSLTWRACCAICWNIPQTVISSFVWLCRSWIGLRLMAVCSCLGRPRVNHLGRALPSPELHENLAGIASTLMEWDPELCHARYKAGFVSSCSFLNFRIIFMVLIQVNGFSLKIVCVCCCILYSLFVDPCGILACLNRTFIHSSSIEPWVQYFLKWCFQRWNL